MSKTIKIMNVSGWTHEVYNPFYVEFPPNQVVEVSYQMGSTLIRQPEFVLVEEKSQSLGQKDKKRNKKKGD